jgi:hypothetical protein
MAETISLQVVLFGVPVMVEPVTPPWEPSRFVVETPKTLEPLELVTNSPTTKSTKNKPVILAQRDFALDLEDLLDLGIN